LEWKNDGVMDDKSGDDDNGEVRWLWRRDESGRDCWYWSTKLYTSTQLPSEINNQPNTTI